MLEINRGFMKLSLVESPENKNHLVLGKWSFYNGSKVIRNGNWGMENSFQLPTGGLIRVSMVEDDDKDWIEPTAHTEEVNENINIYIFNPTVNFSAGNPFYGSENFAMVVFSRFESGDPRFRYGIVSTDNPSDYSRFRETTKRELFPNKQSVLKDLVVAVSTPQYPFGPGVGKQEIEKVLNNPLT